jgi:membrane-associated phospholipid phosphatase
MREKNITLAARMMSMLFAPFYLPVIGLIALYLFSYLSFLPWHNKLFTLILVYAFTIFLPTMLIRTYHKYQGWGDTEKSTKERRMIPYVISILCYFCCFYLLSYFHTPHFVGSIVVASLMIQLTCAIINLWWKISTHSAAIGGVTGAVMAFAEIFNFNPTWWICLILLLAGLVGTSRVILKQHTLSQVVTGYLVGLACAFIAVLFL